MKNSNTCPKCGSHEIFANVTAIDRSHGGRQEETTVATFSKPEAFIFKGQQSTTLSAWVCAKCGFVEYYADSPSTLKINPQT